MLKATLRSQYRSKNSGQKVFVYSVSGNPVELEQYRTASGAFLREVEAPAPDAGTPLFFLTEYEPNGMARLIRSQEKLLITQNNKIVVDDSAEMMRHNALVQEQMASEEAKIRAHARVFRPQVQTAAVVPTRATPKAITADPNQIFDELTGQAPAFENAEQGAGDEGLNG